jgi:NADPH:quinone reductase-like Zn-dependent oxidoreductase
MPQFYRAARYTGRGGHEVVAIGSRELRAPGSGRLLIEVEASAVSASDIMVRKGVVPASPRTFVPGYDLVGRVIEAGPGVDPSWKGKRVIALVVSGGNAEYACARPRQLVPLPDGIDPIRAAALGLNYATALGLLTLAPPGGSVFFQGLTGGVGSALLDLARLSPGLSVAGSASPGRESLAEELGAKAWPYDDTRLVEDVRRAFPAGFDVVFDPFGGGRRKDLANLLKPTGQLVGMGFGGKTLFGYIANLIAYSSGRRRRFFSIASLSFGSPREFARILDELGRRISEGTLNPRISGVYELDELAAAHRRFEERGVTGKLVVRVND